MSKLQGLFGVGKAPSLPVEQSVDGGFESKEAAVAELVKYGFPEELVEKYYDITENENGEFNYDMKGNISDISREAIQRNDGGTDITFTIKLENGNSVEISNNDNVISKETFYDENGEEIVQKTGTTSTDAQNNLKFNQIFQMRKAPSLPIEHNGGFESKEAAVAELVKYGFPEELVEKYYDITENENGEFNYDMKGNISDISREAIQRNDGGTDITFTIKLENGNSVEISNNDNVISKETFYDENGEELISDTAKTSKDV